jgi:hypothetical protein
MPANVRSIDATVLFAEHTAICAAERSANCGSIRAANGTAKCNAELAAYQPAKQSALKRADNSAF